MSTLITDTQFIRTIQAFLPAICRQFQHYLGSKLTLSLGDWVSVSSTGADPVTEGALLTGVRNAFWVSTVDDREILNAETVGNDNFPELRERTINKRLMGVTTDGPDGWLCLHFEDELALSVDRTNVWNTEMALAECTLSDGKIIELSPSGAFELLDEIDARRAAIWNAK